MNFLYFPRQNDELPTYDKQNTSNAKPGSWLLPRNMGVGK